MFVFGLIATIFALSAGSAAAVYGADVSTAVYPSHWHCMANEGYDFAIIRAFQSNGVPDANSPHTIYNAWDGGMKHVDIYMFPDPHAGNPAGQVNSMLDYLAKYNVKHANPSHGPNTFGTVWIDIEGTQYWRDESYNRNFLQGIMNELAAKGVTTGIYASESQWSAIMGGWTGASHLPLWYAHYDYSPSFSDFRPFGGWSRPAIKQYAGTTSLCGAGIDKNYYP